MRWLMWFSIGFAAACAIGVYIALGAWLWVVGTVLLIISIAALIAFARLEKLRALAVSAVILLGVGVGMLWTQCYNAFYLDNAKLHNGQTVHASVEICDYSYRSGGRTVADGYIELDENRFLVRCYFHDLESVKPGDRVVSDFYLRSTTAHEAQEATYHQGKGIFLLAYADEKFSVKSCEETPTKYGIARFRKGILDTLTEVFPPDTAAFARALLLGDSSMLTYGEDTAYKVSGIRHVIAVSGLHVSILFSFVCIFSGRRRYLTAILGIPVLVLFAALAGFTPSVVRACVMQGLMILALLVNKEYDVKTALAFATLVILAVNPWAVTSVGFQLSVGCCLGILLFYNTINTYLLRLLRCPKDKSFRRRITKWFCSGVSTTLSTMVVTAPLSALYFGTVSISGILTNLLALWCVSFTFYGVMAACALGAVWTAGGAAVAWLISWSIRYISFIARVMASLPFASIYTCSIYTVVWLVFCYALLTAFFLLPKKHPGVLAVCMALGLVVSVAASYITPRLDDYRLTVLDVGQGQSILWSCDGKNYLVDCGGDQPASAADTAAQLLLSQGISRLDGIILTHYDTDHAGGVSYLLTRVKTAALYLPDIYDDTGTRQALEREYSDLVVTVTSATTLSTDRMTVTLYPGENSKQENESGICVLFQTENCDILITGDRGMTGERKLLEAADIPKLTLLVAGHHGAKTSTGFELLSATRPAVAVISAGKDNRYGHPHEEVLERFRQFNCAVRRTDLDGTIVFRR